MSTLLLPEVVPETDANPVSFYSRGEGCRSVMVWSLTCPSLPCVAAPGPRWGSIPRSRYRLALLALAMCMSVSTPHFMSWGRPCVADLSTSRLYHPLPDFLSSALHCLSLLASALRSFVILPNFTDSILRWDAGSRVTRSTSRPS